MIILNPNATKFSKISFIFNGFCFEVVENPKGEHVFQANLQFITLLCFVLFLRVQLCIKSLTFTSYKSLLNLTQNCNGLKLCVSC